MVQGRNKILIKKKNLKYGIFVFAILMMDVCFFTIAQIADLLYGLNNNHNKILICGIIFFSFVFLLFTKKISISLKNEYDKFILYYIGIVIVTFCGSLLVYEQSILAVLRNYYYYILLLAYFIIKYFLKKEDFYESLIKLIVVISALYSGILIIAKIIYTITGTIILSQTLLVVTRRNDSLRLMNISGLICIAAVLAIAFVMKKSNSRKFFIVCAVLCVAEVFYISQTRMAEISILVATCIALYFSTIQRRKFLLVIIGVIILIVMNSSIMNFFSTFSVSNDDSIYAYSTSIRLEAYAYYISRFFYHGIFGIGFINSDSYNAIKFGPRGRYVLADAGYIGVVGIFGILGAILIVALIVLFVKQIKRLINTKLQAVYPEAIIIPAYILISSWSLIFNDMQRMLYLPICLAVLNYINEKCNCIEKGQARITGGIY